MVADVVADIQASGEPVPLALARSAIELVLLGVVDQVDHVGEFELLHQAHFVGTDGLVADAELGGDVIHRRTVEQQVEDLHFAVRQQPKTATARLGGVIKKHLFCHFGGDIRSA